MPLYSLTPEHFQEADSQLAERERRQEWGKLHGENMKSDEELIQLRKVEYLQQENAELKRENLLLQGGMDYLEKSKIPWLEKEIERLRK